MAKYFRFAGFLIGISIIAYQAFGLYSARNSVHWPTAIASVLVGENEKDGLKYQYTVDGQQYVSTRVVYGGIPKHWDFLKDPKAAVVAPRLHYMAGAKLPVHYNPESPGQSVVETEYQSYGYTIMAIGFGIAFVMVYGVHNTLGLIGYLIECHLSRWSHRRRRWQPFQASVR